VTDLVIAGAGGGLVGALRAARHGLRVLVVEASEHFRKANNTALCTAMFPAAGTRWQAEAGIADSPDVFVADLMAKTKGGADPRLSRTMAEVSAPLMEWLADEIELPVELVTDFHYQGHSVDRCHTVPGRHGSLVVEHLARRAADHPLIDIMVPATLTDVLLDPDGAVRAAVVRRPDGVTEEIATRAVLLATGGYGGNAELIAEHLQPEIRRAVFQGSAESRGDALELGRRLGADTAFLDAYQGHAGVVAKTRTIVSWATVLMGGVLLDLDGVRFGDETRGYSEYAAELAARPQATGWIVYDAEIHKAVSAFQDYRQTVEAGAVVWGEDASALAEATGLPADAVTKTLAEADKAARGEAVDPFGRQKWPKRLTAPYAAVRVLPALFHTQGGLVVDERAAVLRDGRPIPGLYAAGGAAAGMSGHGADGYLPGNGLLCALGLSYLAADDVAARAGRN
jgi:fumarate reductase flavoprotein subunit